MKWKWNNNLGLRLLAIWLISSGLLHFVRVASIDTSPILAGLAIAAGAFILLGR